MFLPLKFCIYVQKKLRTNLGAPPLAVDNELVLVNTRYNLDNCGIGIAYRFSRQADFGLPITKRSHDIHFTRGTMVPSKGDRNSTLELWSLWWLWHTAGSLATKACSRYITETRRPHKSIFGLGCTHSDELTFREVAQFLKPPEAKTTYVLTVPVD
jgi:hypothetical protein